MTEAGIGSTGFSALGFMRVRSRRWSAGQLIIQMVGRIPFRVVVGLRSL